MAKRTGLNSHEHLDFVLPKEPRARKPASKESRGDAQPEHMCACGKRVNTATDQCIVCMMLGA